MNSAVFCFVSVVLLAAVPWISEAYVCSDTYCTSYPCTSPTSCPNGRIIKNGAPCSCCDLCITQLDEGDECFAVANDILPSQECGPQLTCKPSADDPSKYTCQPIVTDCVKDQRDYDALRNNGSYVIGKHRAKCDYIGYYDSVQCITGSVCFCVSRSGNRLFGTGQEYMESQMLCNCSRDADLLRTSLAETETFSYGKGDYQALPLFAHCVPDGRYDSLQCVDENCFCMDDQLKVKTAITPIDAKETLYCYTPPYHTESYWRPCELKRAYIMDGYFNESRVGDTLVGVDVPECDLDGTYSPVQCENSRCYCALKNGTRMKGYDTVRYSDDAEEQNCYCARDRLLVVDESYRDQVKCKSNGNYAPIQCQGNICYCVSNDGLQKGRDVHKWDIDELGDCTDTDPFASSSLRH